VKRQAAFRDQTGVTLLEMLIVVTIIGIVAGVSFPSITSGLASLRLNTASGSVASFLTSSMNRVDRHEEAAAIVISPQENRLVLFTAASGEKPARVMEMPQGVRIEGEEPRRYLFMPGGTVPRMTVVLRNDQGSRRSIGIDPITAVPDIRRVQEPHP
jgi:prepilin-type N-terminal cleavage/methylation domain-containing protein